MQCFWRFFKWRSPKVKKNFINAYVDFSCWSNHIILTLFFSPLWSVLMLGKRTNFLGLPENKLLWQRCWQGCTFETFFKRLFGPKWVSTRLTIKTSNHHWAIFDEIMCTTLITTTQVAINSWNLENYF